MILNQIINLAQWPLIQDWGIPMKVVGMINLASWEAFSISAEYRYQGVDL